MKRIVSIILALTLICCMLPTAFAASSEATEAANTLHGLGLFNGTGTDANGNPVYDLDRAPTRAEAVTMLVRLLGKESEAKAGTWTTPFTDLQDWAKPYVGYAYANKLTSGTSATTFGGSATITTSQYLTFVLRALGYESGTDFQWDKAWELSDKIGMTDGRYNANSNSFLRGDVAQISKAALSVCEKDSAATLAGQLLDNGAINMGAALFAGVAPNTKTVTFDAKINDKNECWISFSDLKKAFPEIQYYSVTSITNVQTNINDYLCQTEQMLSLITSDGKSGTGRQNGYFTAGNNISVEIMIYSDIMTLCGFSIGTPEKVGNDLYRFKITQCSYDFSNLYERQATAFESANFAYISPENVMSSGATSFIRGYNMESVQDDNGVKNQLYFLWSQLKAETPIWSLFDISRFQESLTWQTGSDTWWRCYLLLDANKQPIGYTIMDSTMA